MANGSSGSNKDQMVSWIAVGIAIFSAFWAVANPRDDIKQLKADEQNALTDFRHEVAGTYETLMQHAEFAKRKDGDTDRMEKQIVAIQADLVSRSEHQQHWAEQSEKVAVLRDQVNELYKELNGSANIGKVLDNIQTRVNTLSDILIGLQSASRRPPTSATAPSSSP